MRKLPFLLVAVLAVLFAACAPATDIDTDIDDANNDAIIESDTSLAGTDCSELIGTYTASSFGFTNVADPAATDTFIETGATYNLGFEDGAFTSAFADPQVGTLEQTGAYAFEDDVLTLGDADTGAFFPGAVGGPQRYRCELRDDGFTLTSNEPVGYDFGAGVENAVFEAEFDRF